MPAGIKFVVFFIGLASLLSQILCIREFLNTFSGNELILGIILGVWLLSTATGAFIGKNMVMKRPENMIAHLMMSTVILLPLQIAGSRYLRGLTIMEGLPGLDFTLFSITLILLPSGILFGGLFVLCSMLAKQSRSVSYLYLYESAGAFTGSLIYVLFQKTGANAMLIITGMIILSIIAFLLYVRLMKLKPFMYYFYPCAGIAMAVFLILIDFENRTLELSYPDQEIIAERISPYGNIVITDSAGQRNFFQNGVPLFSTGDVIAREEAVHFAMCQRPNAGNVLVIGGAITGVTGEVFRYAPENIDYIDIDPVLINASREFSDALEPPVNIFIRDAREFIRGVKKKYDTILIITPDPVSGSLNRFYTLEFFKQIQRILKPGGVISFSLSGSETYMGSEMRRLHSSIFKALHNVFPEVLILPGAKTFYLASDKPLSPEIAKLLKRHNIKTKYVNENYLRGRFTRERLLQADAWARGESRLNTDLEPVSYGYYLSAWIKQFSDGFSWSFLIPLFVIFFLIMIIRKAEKKALAYAVFTTGFTGISLEFSVILVFQIFYGTLYLDIGTLFAAFMLGMATGSYAGLKIPSRRNNLVLLDLSFVLISLSMALFFYSNELSLLSASFSRTLFYASLFILGAISGAELSLSFPSASEVPEVSASNLYSADLLGSCAGGFLTGAFLIPSLGIIRVCIIFSFLKLMSAGMLWLEVKGERLPSAVRPWYGWNIMLAIIISAGTLILLDKTSVFIYSLSLGPVQTFLTLGSLLIALTLSAGRYRFNFKGSLKLAQFLSLSLVAFYPVFRCFFKVPYLFCHVCPRQCAFGIYRKYAVSTAVLTNNFSWPFCHMTCPVGIMYNVQPVSEKRIPKDSFRYLYPVRLIILLSIPFIYFKSKFDEKAMLPGFMDIYNFMFKNEFSANVYVIIFAGIFILGGFFIPRLFCNLLCPIGAVADITRGISNYFKQSYKNNIVAD